MKYSILCTVSKYDGGTSIQLTRTFDNTGFERLSASSPGEFPATLGADKYIPVNGSYSVFTPKLVQTLMRLPWYRPGSVLSFIDLNESDPMYQYNQEILAFHNAFKDKKFLPGSSGTYCDIEVTDDSQIAKINDLFNRLGIPQVVNAPVNIETLRSATSASAQVQAPAALTTNVVQDVVIDGAGAPGGPTFK